MYLKKLEIQGFKSFADKTEIEFKEGITGIVGPNGSGKSNILDAIRWVLGEQSIKTLRGNKMEDVIFSGTDKRKPLGFSEVTITFDNKDGIISLDYSEVSVTRRMFRSGESEYYINKNSCRLKDIRELFMDTGVGKDGYSIIGQGRVDEILSTKSEDRRNIFEEAAGIVKYKSRKEDGEKKLEKTEENLIRINDILFELEEQIDPLEKQCSIAKEYLKMSNRLKDLEVNLYINEINRLTQKLTEIKEEREKLNEKVNIYLEEKENIENKYFTIKNQIDNMDKSIEDLQGERYSVQRNIGEKEHQLALYNEKERFYIKERERLERELIELEKKKEDLKTDSNKLSIEIKDNETELFFLRNRYFEENEILKELSNKIDLKEKNIDKERDNVIEAYNLISDKKNKVNSLNAFKESINKRINEIEKEIDILTKEKEEKDILINKLFIEEEKKKVELSSSVNFKNEYLQKEKIQKEEYGLLVKEIDESKAALQGKLSNYNLLKNMEEDYEGYYKSVRSLLLAAKQDFKLNNGIVGVVGELIKVNSSYEKAIEIALGSSLQNIVTKSEENAKEAIEYLRKNNLGRVTFLPLTSIKGKKLNVNLNEIKKLGGIDIASRLVTFDEEYRDVFEYLLGRTLVVKDIDCGINIAKKYRYSFKIVTIEGDVLNTGGSITGGSISRNNTSILNRKNRIDSLLEEITKLREKLKLYEEKEVKFLKEIEETNRHARENDEEAQSINIDIIKLENERTKISSDIEKVSSSISKYLDEIDKLKEEISDIDSQIDNLNIQLNQLEEGRDSVKNNIKEMIEKFEKEKEFKEQLVVKVTDLKIKVNSIENNISSFNERLLNINKDYETTIEDMNKKEIELNENRKSNDEINKLRKIVYDEINDLNLLLNNYTEKLDKLKKDKKLFMDNFSLEQQKLKEANDNINYLEKSINRLDVKYAKYSVQIENYNAKLLEEYELTYDEAQDYEMEIEDFKIVDEEIKELKDSIRKLGTVNLGAIEEYKRVKERFQFIKGQSDDLLSAKKSLKKVIKNMEEKMKEQFIEKFNIIRSNFGEVFKELFGGGKADVYLIDEEDVLSSGIEIIAQPPGKKLQSLSLLSGGEKSLTAVALLFAILKTKPTPFCILDEIDAALDEANITRYTNYLKSFSDNTQFIMITHRRGSMEMADVLYGVTMEEEGISRLVSVKLSDKVSEKAS